MASARAVYHWDADSSLAVQIDVEANYPDSVAEATARCRDLMRDVATDLAVEIAALDDVDEQSTEP